MKMLKRAKDLPFGSLFPFHDKFLWQNRLNQRYHIPLKFLKHFIAFLYFRSTLEFLSNEGHIYSTIDDDHYKSTDSY